MSLKKFILILILMNPHWGFAQPADVPFQPALPPSPLTENILKYGDIPVDLHSGVPDISIPIYEINTGTLKLPISLNYHASGIKVHELANNVGLGWTLNAEGIIFQSVLGNLDNGDYQNYGINFPIRGLNPSIAAELDTLYALARQSHDGIPDLYTYNFDGHSGRFIEGYTNSFITMPQKNIQITRSAISGGSANHMYTWKIIAEDGTQYWFSDSAEISYTAGAGAKTNSTTWYLTHIVSPNLSDTIYFHYRETLIIDNPYQSESITSWANAYTGCETCPDVTGTFVGYNPISGPGVTVSMSQSVFGRQLERIDFRNGSVEYKIDWDNRADYPIVPFSGFHIPKVDKVIVRDKSGSVIKVAHLQYSYFNTTATSPTQKRLRLDFVTFNANAITPSTTDAQWYKIDYNSTVALPDRYSKAIDHWGYFNGALGNTQLVPTMPDMPGHGSATYTYYGADREPHPAYVQAGTIQKITYPTGGWTEFEFEPNNITPSPLTYHALYDSTYSLTTTYASPYFFTSANDAGDAFYVDPARFPTGVDAELTSTQNSYGNPIVHSRPYVAIKDLATNGILADYDWYSNVGSSGMGITQDFSIPAGRSCYLYAFHNGAGGSTSAPHPYTTCIITLKLYNVLPSPNTIVGGIRIKKITNHDQYTNVNNVKHYSYLKPNSVYSSGQVLHMPDYISANYFHHTCTYTTGGTDPHVAELRGITLHSNSVVPLGTGSLVNYSYVTEFNGETSLGGYSVSHFTNFSDAPCVGELDQSWRRGLLLDRIDFDRYGVMKFKTKNKHKYDFRPYSVFNGRDVSYVGEPSPLEAGPNVAYCPSNYQIKPYQFPSEWLYVDTTYDTTYYPGGLLTNTKYYFFDNMHHKELTRYYTDLSDGTQSLLQIKYPSDYVSTILSGSSELTNLYLMDARHMHSYPVEKVNFKKDATGNFNAVSGKYTEWMHPATDWLEPFKEYVLRTTSPLSGFNMSGPTSMGLVNKNSNYQLENTINQYDDRENIIDVKLNKTNEAYLNFYRNQYMVAKVKNASQNQIAYNGFETLETGNWVFNPANIVADFITGKFGYQMNSDLVFNSASGAYSGSTYNCIVSYWQKGLSSITVNGVSAAPGITVNGWTYHEHAINASATVTVHDNATGVPSTIDELRLYPINAQMETYTYIPLIGMTAKSDVNNNITYYSYDNLARLELVKDKRGNIVKKMEYGIQKSE